MKKRSIIVLTLLAGCFTNSFAQKGEKTLTVEVSNEWTQNKTDEPVVIDLNNLKAGFNIKSATVWEGNKEIPSQLDDLNGDARADELAFLIDMPAKSIRRTHFTRLHLLLRMATPFLCDGIAICKKGCSPARRIVTTLEMV